MYICTLTAIDDAATLCENLMNFTSVTVEITKGEYNMFQTTGPKTGHIMPYVLESTRPIFTKLSELVDI